jgi:hypothetical protein
MSNTAAPVTIPDIATIESVRRARERLVRAQTDLAATQQEVEAALTPRSDRTPGRDATTQAAERYLDGSDADRDPLPTADERRALVESLMRRREVLTRAVELARREVDSAEAAASRAICEQVAAEHRERVRDVLLALAELSRANERLHAFYEGLRDRGVSSWASWLRPSTISQLGRANDRYSLVALALREAVQYGLVDAKALEGSGVVWQ